MARSSLACRSSPGCSGSDVNERELETLALRRFLQILVEGSRAARLSLVRLDERSGPFFGQLLEAVARHESDSDVVRAHATLALIVRSLWSMVPARLFSAIRPNYRSLAQEAIARHFDTSPVSAEFTHHLSTIFKRLRLHVVDGRHATSLDLERVAHQELLASQDGRCNHCRYEFASEPWRYAEEFDDVPSEPYDAHEGEVVADNVYRRPELDHVVPVILGGDSDENWQILCATCNRGKRDLLVYFGGFYQIGAGRMNELVGLSAGKRFAVIADARDPAVVSGDGKFFRVFRRDPQGFTNRENLVAKYG